MGGDAGGFRGEFHGFGQGAPRGGYARHAHQRGDALTVGFQGFLEGGFRLFKPRRRVAEFHDALQGEEHGVVLVAVGTLHEYLAGLFNLAGVVLFHQAPDQLPLCALELSLGRRVAGHL